MRPPATRSRTPCHCGCVRTMNASAICTPVRSRASHSCARLARRESDRLLTQHVLARFRGANRPRYVQMIRQRIVDRFDVRIGDQLFVRPVSARNRQCRRRIARLGQNRATQSRRPVTAPSPASRESPSARRCLPRRECPSGRAGPSVTSDHGRVPECCGRRHLWRAT